MQEEPAPQVTPTQNDKPEQAAVKPSTAAAAAPTTHQANNEPPSISKSSDNTRDRMEETSPNRPKSRTKHNPTDQLPPEDSKMAAKPQHQELPLPPKANTTLKHPQPDNTLLAEPPQKKAPTPQSSETITFKHMEGGTQIWNHKYSRLTKHSKMYPMEKSEAQFMSNSIVQVMATYKGLKRLDVPGCLEAASNTHYWFKLMSSCRDSKQALPKNISEQDKIWIKGIGVRLVKTSPEQLTGQALNEEQEFKLCKSPLHAIYYASRQLWGFPWTRWGGEEPPHSPSTPAPNTATNSKQASTSAQPNGGWKLAQTNKNKPQAKELPKTKKTWMEITLAGFPLSGAIDWKEQQMKNNATAKRFLSAISNGLKTVDPMAPPPPDSKKQTRRRRLAQTHTQTTQGPHQKGIPLHSHPHHRSQTT